MNLGEMQRALLIGFVSGVSFCVCLAIGIWGVYFR